MALGNGYLGMRGCHEEGGPDVENSTLINGFYETHPIVYGEDAYGFAKTGQTICNVTDTKAIKLFVDDEPFWLPHANLLRYDRRLNMKLGTLDREILWETPAGKQVLITSRRLVSFVEQTRCRHLLLCDAPQRVCSLGHLLGNVGRTANHPCRSQRSTPDESGSGAGTRRAPITDMTVGSCCAMARRGVA